MQDQPSANQEPLARAGVPCQLEAVASSLRDREPGLDEPWTWYVRRRARGAWRRLTRAIGRLGGAGSTLAATPVQPTATFAAGDLVRVRSAEEIRRTLDAKGGIKGCFLASGMYQFSGRELRVLRPVRRFFDEGRYRMLRAKDMVLLDGVHCDGASLPDTGGCDRQCYYFWRTEWLEKVQAAGDPPPT